MVAQKLKTIKIAMGFKGSRVRIPPSRLLDFKKGLVAAGNGGVYSDGPGPLSTGWRVGS